MGQAHKPWYYTPKLSILEDNREKGDYEVLHIRNFKDQAAIITVSRAMYRRENKTLIIVISNSPLSNCGCEKKKEGSTAHYGILFLSNIQ